MKWISVKDRLPNPEEWVLVTGNKKRQPTEIFKAQYDYNAWVTDWCCDYNLETVTHWLPLPELPPEQPRDKEGIT